MKLFMKFFTDDFYETHSWGSRTIVKPSNAVNLIIKIGFIGLGVQAENLIRNFIDGHFTYAQISAICELNPERLDKIDLLIQHLLHTPVQKFTDYHKLIENAEISVVFITVPDFLHYEVAMAALKAKKHVFLEKPIATNIDHMMEIIRAAHDAKIVFETGYVLRYTPFYSGVKELLVRNEIGRPLFAQALEQFYGGAGIYYRSWWRIRKNTGGILLTKISHDLDLMNWFFGKPLKVVCFSSVMEFKPGNWNSKAKNCSECTNHCPYYVAPQISRNHDDLCIYNTDLTGADVVDNAQVLVQYESGLNVSVGMNFFNSHGQNDRFLRIVGSKAEITGRLSEQSVRIDARHDPELRHTSFLEFAPSGLAGHAGGNNQQIAEFLEAIYHGTEAKAGLESAYWGSLLVMGAQISADSGAIIDLKALSTRYPFPK